MTSHTSPTNTSLVYPMNYLDQAKLHCLSKFASQEQAHLLQGFASYHYPFSLPVRVALEREKRSTIPLLAYGSLMNRQSATKTLDPQTVATMKPAIAFGLKRIYNYYVPKSPQFGVPDSPFDTAMLNTELSYSMQNVINGVVIDLPKEELLALCKREIGYDLVPVIAVSWEDALKSDCDSAPRFFVVYVLQAPQTPRQGKLYTREDIAPFPQYYDLVKQSAAQYGHDFLSLYMDTTYLSNGKTTIREWEDRRHLSQ